MIYLETGSTDPYYNLAYEEWVLTHLTEGEYLILWQNDNAVIIGKYQNTQFKLAEMQTKTDAARLMVWRAATEKDNHGNYAPLAAMCKYFASDVANEVTRMAVQLFGGYGYTREYPVERMMRDAKITEIYEGTSEVQRMVIAKYLGVN